MADYDSYRKTAYASIDGEKSKPVQLGDESLFKLFIGKRVLKKDLPSMTGEIPVYSANVFEPFGYISQSNITTFEHPCILWGIDGNFDTNLIPPKIEFATTDHCGVIQILDKGIDPEYLLYAIEVQKIEESYDRSFRASLANMKRFSVRIPISADGKFDIDAQKRVALFFVTLMEKRENLVTIKSNLDNLMLHYLSSNKMGVQDE